MDDMEYRVVSGDTVETLSFEVNAAIQKGWEPNGGVAVVPTGEGFCTFYQAMIRFPIWNDHSDEEV